MHYWGLRLYGYTLEHKCLHKYLYIQYVYFKRQKEEREVEYKLLAHTITEAEKFYCLLSLSWGHKRVGGII